MLHITALAYETVTCPCTTAANQFDTLGDHILLIKTALSGEIVFHANHDVLGHPVQFVSVMSWHENNTMTSMCPHPDPSHTVGRVRAVFQNSDPCGLSVCPLPSALYKLGSSVRDGMVYLQLVSKTYEG